MSSAVRFSLACIATAAIAPAASAQALPPGCIQDPSYASAYERARSLGRNLASSVWDRMSDCTRLGPYVDRVVGGLRASRPKTANARLVCRYAGLVDGALALIREASRSCGQPCCREGELVGELSAQLYCDLAQLLGSGEPLEDFIPQASAPCSDGFRACCSATFDVLSSNYEGPSAGGATFACRPYTEGASREAWSLTRELTCSPDPL